MKVWITKYAFTDVGIYEQVVRGPSHGRWVEAEEYIPPCGTRSVQIFYSGQWHETREAAIERVREMVGDERRRLNERLAKLDAIERHLRQKLPDAERLAKGPSNV